MELLINSVKMLLLDKCSVVEKVFVNVKCWKEYMLQFKWVICLSNRENNDSNNNNNFFVFGDYFSSKNKCIVFVFSDLKLKDEVNVLFIEELENINVFGDDKMLDE